MEIPVPNFKFIEIPFYILIPIFWFLFLWTFNIFYNRCECGAFYHTKKEKKQFQIFILFTILSTIIIYVILLNCCF